MSQKLFLPKFKITHPILNNLMEIERAKGFLDATHLSNQWIKKMSQRAFILETHHTTHIEGTQLTLEQSERILSGKKTSGHKEDIKEVKNYRDAFNLVSDYLKKETIIKESIIKKIHKELVKGVRGDSAQPGKYRTIQNYIGNPVTGKTTYIPPKPKEVPALMKNFVTWINEKSEIHPVIKSGIIQFQFVYIHPFIDGNGRTSRLLCALYLYKSGYDFKQLFSISQYYDKDRRSFYKAIQSVKKNNMDMTEWLEYFVKGFLFQMNEAMKKGKKVIWRDTLIKDYDLSKKQILILDYILEKNELRSKDFDHLCIKIGNIKKTSKDRITRRTLQRNLKDMIDKKILASKGTTNNKSYRLLKKI